jgi:hypothetical protein
MITRRDLLIRTALTAPILTFAGKVLADTHEKLVTDADPVAKALKYVEDATKATRPDKMGVPGKKQTCANCSMFTKGKKIDGKEAGKCTMIAGGQVTAAGWCTGWAKKA